jgi:hypothetical protein
MFYNIYSLFLASKPSALGFTKTIIETVITIPVKLKINVEGHIVVPL